MPPSAFSTPGTALTSLQQRRGEGRGLAGVLLDDLLRGDDDVGALQGRVEDVVERPVDRVREDVGARDQRHAEEDGEHRARGAELARREALQRDGDHVASPRPSSARGPRPRRRPAPSWAILPSCRTTRRSANDAACGSWVTITTVWPKSSTAWRSSSSTSSEAFESRLPVGSSANTTAGCEHERARDRDALLLAAGELRRAVRAAVAEADDLDQLLEPLAVGLAARDRQRQHDVLLGRQHRQQVEELEDEPELVAAQLGQRAVVEPCELGPVDETEPDVGRVEAGEDVHQGRLARAGRAHDRGEPARGSRPSRRRGHRPRCRPRRSGGADPWRKRSQSSSHRVRTLADDWSRQARR